MKMEPELEEVGREPWAWMWRHVEAFRSCPWESGSRLPLIPLDIFRVRVLYNDGTWEELPSGEELDRWRRQNEVWEDDARRAMEVKR